MKSAIVYCRADAWYVGAMSQTTTGLWIGTPPDIKVSHDAGDGRLGQAVIDCLKASQQSIPHPTEWDNSSEPMLKLANVRSWTEFMRSASNVSVDADESSITIEPTRQMEVGSGYAPLPDKSIRIPLDSSGAIIGQAVRKAIAQCQ